MPDNDTSTVTVTQPAMTVTSETEPVCHTLLEYAFFKVDRTIAIVGLIVLGGWALWVASTESLQIAIAVVGVLGGYVGGRSGK